MKLVDIIEELIKEKGLSEEVVKEIISEGMLAAYQKKYPERDFQIKINRKKGEITTNIQKKVVSSREKETIDQIGLKRARLIDKKTKEDDLIWVPFEESVGRIEILKARQAMISKIRKVEAATVYTEFKEKEGEVVVGVIHKCSREGTVVKLDDALALLPRSLSVPTDKCAVGFSVRALLKEVLLEPQNDYQLILDRTSDLFLKKLFELEIPEIFERLVEIKTIIRAPGYKSKVVVTSHDDSIDPVGTCVGLGGSRIKPILKELGGEKIDVIEWKSMLDELVASALKPAKIDRVELSEDNKTAYVWLPEDQRSIAIGKMGQNISLASRLAGVDIQLVQPEEKNKQSSSEDENQLDIE